MNYAVGVAAAGLIVVVGYLALSGGETPEPVAVTPVAVPEAPVVEEAEAPAAGDSVEQVVNDVAADVAEQVTEQVTGAVEAVEAGATEAVEALEQVSEAVDSEAVTEVAEDVAAAAGDMATQVQEEVSEAVETVTEGAAELVAPTGADLFSVAGFDFDKAVEFIKASNLNPLARNALTQSLSAARDNPELLASALAAARQQLGL